MGLNKFMVLTKSNDMKNVILSVIFTISSLICNAQEITINVFQTSELNVFTFDSLGEVIQNIEYDVVNTIQNTFTYELNFNTKKCSLKDENGFIVGESDFIIKSKKSGRDFQIEFVTDGSGAPSGILVTETKSAYYIEDSIFFYCTIFETSFIF